LNLADLLPTTSIWPGLEHNPCPFYTKNSPPLFYAATTGYSPFRVSLHVGDVGHTLILGPTGSGKSTLLSFIMAQSFRYKNAQVFCFDKGYSAYILANACAGEHFDIAGDKSNLAFCPLANVDLPLERFWAEDWIETLLELQNVKITPGSRQKIHHAMGLLASSDSRTMTDFINTIQDADLREALTPYSLAGSMGRLLDAKLDSLTDRKNKGNRFQIFEMEHLMALGERNIVPVLTYLFHRIDNQLDGSPSLIVLDESWLFISHPIFRDKIREWLKTLRKNNTAVIFATQSITDIANSPIRDVVYESCPTKILLPNPEAGNEVCKQEYSRIGLNDQQIELIKSAIPKRHYYYLSTYGKRLFELGLGDVAKAFTASSSKEDIKLAKNLIDTYGQTWPAEWLKSKNLDDSAKAWMEFK
jgi:type IV secretion system protein VirB4